MVPFTAAGSVMGGRVDTETKEQTAIQTVTTTVSTT